MRRLLTLAGLVCNLPAAVFAFLLCSLWWMNFRGPVFDWDGWVRWLVGPHLLLAHCLAAPFVVRRLRREEQIGLGLAWAWSGPVAAAVTFANTLLPQIIRSLYPVF